MRKKAFLLILGLALGFSTAFATPPKSIAVSYKEGTLNIRINHETENSENHFINKIIIYLNGALILNNEFKDQSSGKTQEFFFQAGLRKGDIVEIRAFCNKKGGRAVKYTVP